MSVRQTETAICTNIQQLHMERFTAEHTEKPIKTPTVSQQTRQQQHHIRLVKKRAMTGKCVFRCLSGSLGKHRTPQTKPTKWVGNISWFCTCADNAHTFLFRFFFSLVPGWTVLWFYMLALSFSLVGENSWMFVFPLGNIKSTGSTRGGLREKSMQ